MAGSGPPRAFASNRQQSTLQGEEGLSSGPQCPKGLPALRMPDLGGATAAIRPAVQTTQYYSFMSVVEPEQLQPIG